MKPKEYAKVFSPWDPRRHNEFVSQIKADIVTTFENAYHLAGSQLHLARGQSLTREAREKFDRIRELIPEVPESIWNYLFASTIKPLQNELCAKDIARFKAKKRREAEYNASFYTSFEAFDFSQFIERVFGPATHDSAAMSFFGLSANYTTTDVQAAFRKKAVSAHPDTGGSHTDFLHLVDMKNRALRYAQPAA